MTREEVENKLGVAAKLLEDAMKGCVPESKLHREIRKLFDEVDYLSDCINIRNDESGEYTDSFPKP